MDDLRTIFINYYLLDDFALKFVSRMFDTNKEGTMYSVLDDVAIEALAETKRLTLENERVTQENERLKRIAAKTMLEDGKKSVQEICTELKVTEEWLRKLNGDLPAD